jgi:AraC family transcriptional regulator, transcriptional activator FtrA
MPPHREGGQAQYVRLSPSQRHNTSLAPLLDWATAHLDQPLTIARLAQHAGMSARTFVRHFDNEVGESPGQWILSQRIRAAQELLEQTNLPVEAIAIRVGLAAAGNLRHHFRRIVGTTPAGYRRTFQQPGLSQERGIG